MTFFTRCRATWCPKYKAACPTHCAAGLYGRCPRQRHEMRPGRVVVAWLAAALLAWGLSGDVRAAVSVVVAPVGWWGMGVLYGNYRR